MLSWTSKFLLSYHFLCGGYNLEKQIRSPNYALLNCSSLISFKNSPLHQKMKVRLLIAFIRSTCFLSNFQIFHCNSIALLDPFQTDRENPIRAPSTEDPLCLSFLVLYKDDGLSAWWSGKLALEAVVGAIHDGDGVPQRRGQEVAKDGTVDDGALWGEARGQKSLCGLVWAWNQIFVKNSDKALTNQLFITYFHWDIRTIYFLDSFIIKQISS